MTGFDTNEESPRERERDEILGKNIRVRRKLAIWGVLDVIYLYMRQSGLDLPRRSKYEMWAFSFCMVTNT